MPASNNLFEAGESGLLSDNKRKIFHKTIVKGIFVAGRLRPDITPTISVLSGRVRCPNQNNWEKCQRLMKYLNGTKDLHLILRWDGLSVARWHVDAAFAVHPDFKSHSGGILLLHPDGGGIAVGRTKQRLNTRSITEVELVACDDFLTKILWMRRFMKKQGILFRDNNLLQDNKSCIQLAKNGRSSLGKRS